MRGVAFQRSSCAFSKAWTSSSVFTITPSCVVEVESMASPHLYGHHPPCACLWKGKLPTHISTCSPRPKANGTEQNQYLTKDSKPDSRQQKRLWWLLLKRHSCYKICLSHQREVNPIVTLNSTQVLPDFELLFLNLIHLWGWRGNKLLEGKIKPFCLQQE